ncbi:MAG: thioesterase family protein [Desulfovibrio sp.]|jgi:predicted thioesterase|nr:thioesterase family protein [Desulfovibrio sp.]
MSIPLKTGLTAEYALTVDDSLLADRIGSGRVSVYATAMMIAGMEHAAVEAVADALESGLTTVGTLVNVKHLAATPSGMKVRCTAELTAVTPNGKGLTFQVKAHDEAGLIGEGIHERVVVNRASFQDRTQARKGSA